MISEARIRSIQSAGQGGTKVGQGVCPGEHQAGQVGHVSIDMSLSRCFGSVSTPKTMVKREVSEMEKTLRLPDGKVFY